MAFCDNEVVEPVLPKKMSGEQQKIKVRLCSLANKTIYCTMCIARGELGLVGELNGHHYMYLPQFGHSVKCLFTIDNTNSNTQKLEIKTLSQQR